MKRYLLIIVAIMSAFSVIYFANQRTITYYKSTGNNIITAGDNYLMANKIVQPHKQNKLNSENKEMELQKQLAQTAQNTIKNKENTAVKAAAATKKAAERTSQTTTSQTTKPTEAPIVLVPVSKLKAGTSSQQLIVITNKSITSYKAVCNVYEKVNGQWKYVWKNLYAVTGNNGMSYNRHEGDKTSPAGIFTITQAFGIANNPGTKLPYRVVQENDWWAGDSQDPSTYNTWQKAPSTGWRESESEHLIDISLYKYAMVIDFNTARIPYKGSAIFFHIAPYSGGGTAGCIGVKESDLVKILKWINPSKNPKIIICPESDLNKF